MAYWNNPGFFPENYDPSGLQQNPAATNPFPPPKGAPVGVWNGGRSPLALTTLGAPLAFSGRWESPTFDLRPDIRAYFPDPGGQPIWRANGLGAGGSLWCLVTGIRGATTNMTGLQVTFQEWVHPWDPNSMVIASDAVDITKEFNSATKNAVLLNSCPPGYPYPIRFWRIRYDFIWKENGIPAPNFVIQSAYY